MHLSDSKHPTKGSSTRRNVSGRIELTGDNTKAGIYEQEGTEKPQAFTVRNFDFPVLTP